MADFVTWYQDEATYERFKSLCVDKEHFGPSYASWVSTVQRKLDEAARAGLVLTKVHIDPEGFSAWCRANAQVPNARARALFAGVVHGSGHSAGGDPTH